MVRPACREKFFDRSVREAVGDNSPATLSEVNLPGGHSHIPSSGPATSQSSHRCCYGDGGYCQLCGAEPREEDAAVGGPGEGEDEDEDELLGKDEMRADKKDGVWRCVHCH